MLNGAAGFVLVAALDTNTGFNANVDVSADTDTNAPYITRKQPPTTRSLPDGTIAAGVVGVILTAAIVLFITWICVERRRQRWTTSSPMSLHTRPVHPEDGRAPSELRSLTDDPGSHSWMADRDFWDPRESSSQGVRSPTPKPAVAAVRSHTRHQRAQLCYIGGRGRPVAQLHRSEPAQIPDQLDISPMTSISRTDSTYHDSSRASPLFQDCAFGPWFTTQAPRLCFRSPKRCLRYQQIISSQFKYNLQHRAILQF
ncbi:hypothetical protein B0J13DRAFT_521314 [Dactylonectria estremocensis]|uniref:Uncharacterized protein n=1 Tax=Dactylonectria estremocensis TaxID=1079267 RepID=A0A9P9F6J2_9HYPO|nr:hypothetical protein B0J13DRAFT_521314 [Dactylonectria estremocensis]